MRPGNTTLEPRRYSHAVRGAKAEFDMAKLIAFLKDNNGATAIEYGLIAAGIAATIIVVVNGLGTNLNTTFTSISTQLK